MALELDWTDSSTGVTYNDAYAIIGSITHTKGANNVHSFTAKIKIYKDATAKSNGKAPIASTTFLTTKVYQSSDTGSNYRNIINQIYNDMKQHDPWDDATDV
jgi:hypothetical protein